MKATTLEKRPGVWRIRIEDRDAAGNRVFRYKTVRGTKRDATTAAARLVVALEAGERPGGTLEAPKGLGGSSGLPLPGTGPTVGAWAEQWLSEWGLLGRVAPTTLITYRAAIRHIVRTWGTHRLTDLNRTHVVTGLATLARTLAPRTVRHVHTRLWSVLAEAQARGMVGGNAAHKVPLPKAPTTRGRALTTGEKNAVLGKARDHRLGPVIRFVLGTGLRRGEVAALTWDDVVLGKEPSVSVSKSLVQMGTGGREYERPPKSEAGVRRVSLPQAVADELRAMRSSISVTYRRLGMEIGAQPVFINSAGNRWKSGRLGDVVADFLHNEAGVDLTIHDLRHAHATELLRAGENVRAVAARLGHADPSVTLKVYGHVLPSDDARLAQKINEAMKETKR